MAGRPPERAGGGNLSVPVEGDGALAETVRALDAADIEVVELSLRLPSLDEVFFAVTGRHSDEHDEKEAA